MSHVRCHLSLALSTFEAMFVKTCVVKGASLIRDNKDDLETMHKSFFQPVLRDKYQDYWSAL